MYPSLMYRFTRGERLKSAKRIGRLFELRQSVGEYPLRLFWDVMPEGEPGGALLQAAFSVPRRKFKRAVWRNHLRRRMREAYRLLKPRLYARLRELHPGKRFSVLLLFAGDRLEALDDVGFRTQIMDALWERWFKKINK